MSTDIFNPGDEMVDFDPEDYDLNSHGQLSLGTTKKRKLMKKAPDAPKRFKSAYICFIGEKMEFEKANGTANNPDTKVTDIMKVLANKWKELHPSEKERYELMAIADKQRYMNEMQDYNGPLQVPNKRVKKNPVSRQK
jgi:hypothetical protein